MKVLVNGIGITNSGGLIVLEKFFIECLEVESENIFVIILSKNPLISSLVDRYRVYQRFDFRVLEIRNYMHRLYFENFGFKDIIRECDIDLIYNFTGSAQPFLNCLQLVKIHNLLFYSNRLNKRYREKFKFFLWISQILFKSIVFRFMLKRTRYIEIQSKHIECSLSDFINTTDKRIFIKSDIDVVNSSFKAPKHYNFSKKIKFLYIVGPHFDYMHKNFIDFTRGMVRLIKLGFDFEIDITLTKDQLAQSTLWDKSLDAVTNFYGYLNDPRDVEALFRDNTVLISTSIIETLGLHVIEAIKNGILTITPKEYYANEVYGEDRYCYELFSDKSLSNTIMNILNDEDVITNKILVQQRHLRENEMNKFNNVIDIFSEVLNV